MFKRYEKIIKKHLFSWAIFHGNVKKTRAYYTLKKWWYIPPGQWWFPSFGSWDGRPLSKAKQVAFRGKKGRWKIPGVYLVYPSWIQLGLATMLLWDTMDTMGLHGTPWDTQMLDNVGVCSPVFSPFSSFMMILINILTAGRLLYGDMGLGYDWHDRDTSNYTYNLGPASWH